MGYTTSVNLFFQLKSGVPTLLEGQSFNQNAMDHEIQTKDYSYCRELSEALLLEPGNYVVIPSIHQPNVPRQFLLRFCTERGAEARYGEKKLSSFHCALEISFVNW